MFKALMGGGRSSSDARSSSSSKSGSRRKTSSKASSTVSRKSSRGDDRDRGLGDLSAYPSQSSRSGKRYASSAAGDSVASSYATAEPGILGEPDRVIIERTPKRKDSDYDEREDQYSRNRETSGLSRSRSARDHSPSRERDDSRDRDSRRRERQRTQSGDSYGTMPPSSGSEYGAIPVTSEPPQVPFPTTSGPDPQNAPTAYDPHVQQQFPGQFPTSFAKPYRPPNPAGEAADYYGDQGQSVAQQPGVRPKPPLVIPNSHAHLMPASPSANPPPEPSSVGQLGAAASYYDDDNDAGPGIHSTEQPLSSPASKPPKPSKPSAQSAGILGATAAATAYGIGAGSSDPTPSEHVSSAPPAAYAPLSHPSPPKPSHSHGVGAAVGVAAAGAAAGYMLGHGHHSSSSVDHTSQYTMQNPDEISEIGIGHPGPSMYNTSPGNPDQYAAGVMAGVGAVGAVGYAASPLHPHHAALYHGAPFPSGALGFQQRQRGPLDKFIEFWRDTEGVGMFEDYTETIGICKYCFEPGTTSRDAPRTHHYKLRRRSSDRITSGSRVDKANRYASSEDESRRRKSSQKSWLPGLLGGYAVKSLFDNKDFDDTYSVQSGRVVSASHDSESTSASGRRSQTSRGVYKSTRRAGSRDRSHRNAYSDPQAGRYEDARVRTRSRSRSRSRSSSRSKGHGLRDAALGAAVGTAAMSLAKSRHRDSSRSRSPRKSRRKSSSSDSSSFVDISRNNRRSVGGFTSFFTATSENRRKQHTPRRRKSIFSFNNSSSSSLDNDLAFGNGFTKNLPRKLKKRSPKRDKPDIDARLLELGATATALAAASPHRTRRTGEILVGHGSRSGRSDYTSSAVDEDGWEDLDSGDSSASSALAFGGGGRFGGDGSSPSDSGSGWGWGWASKSGKKKKKKKDKKKRRSSSPDNRFPTGAAVAAGAIGAAALAYHHRDHKSSSHDAESSVGSLQQVAAVPTSDPSRFDAMTVSSFPPAQPPLVRPGSIPLQQPQPVTPVSQALYTTQGASIHSYSAPPAPAAFVSPFESYEPQLPNIASHNWNPPTSDHREYHDRDISHRDIGPHRRSDSSPVFPTEPLEGSTMSTLKRRSTTKDQPSVQFDLTQEQADKERRADRRERKRQDAERESQIQLIDREEEFEQRDARYGSRQYKERSYESRRAEEDELKKDKSSSWSPAAVAAVGAVGAIGAATVLSKNAPSDITSETSERSSSERRQKRRAERRRATEPLPSVSSIPDTEHDRDEIEDHPSPKSHELEHIKTSAFRGVGSKKSVYDDYAEFFYPQKLRHSPDSSSRREKPSMPTIIEREPATETPPSTEEPRPKFNTLPWPVPELRIIEPTPPHSASGSVRDASSPIQSPTEEVPEEDEKVERPTGSRVSWGEHSMHEYEVPSTSSEHDSIDMEQRERDHVFEEATRDAPGYSYVTPSASGPDVFGDDIEFAATVAAATQAAGFDPSLVTDDPTYHTRTSPPGSEIRDRSVSPKSQGQSHSEVPHPFVEEEIEPPKSAAGKFFSDRPIFADPEPTTLKDQDEGIFDSQFPSSVSERVLEQLDERQEPTITDSYKASSRSVGGQRDVTTHDQQEESESPGEELFSMPGGFESDESQKRSKRRSTSPPSLEPVSRSIISEPLVEEPRSPETSRESIVDLDINETPEDGAIEEKKKKKRRKRRSKGDNEALDDSASIASSVATTSSTSDKRKSTDEKDKEKRIGGFFGSIFGSRVSEPVESKKSSSTEKLPTRDVQSEIGTRTSEGSKHRRKSSRHRSSSRGDPSDNDSRPYDHGFMGQEDSFTADKENINVESYKNSRQRREEKRRQKYGETDELGKAAEYEKDQRTSQDSDRDLSFLAERPEMPRKLVDDDYNDGASGRASSTDDETRGLGLGFQGRRPRSHSTSPPVSGKIVEPILRSHARSVSPDRALGQGDYDDLGSRRSSVLRSTESPTAVPLHFRRPPTSPSTQRSPSTSSPPAPSPSSPSSPTHGRSRRPNSTEFRSSREIRPLWLVERHGSSKIEAQEDDVLPSLPSSKPSSASASVEDLTALPDENIWETREFSPLTHGTRGVDDFDTREFDPSYTQYDVLGSQQGTPTRATFSQGYMHVPHQSRKAQLGYEFHSPSELLQDPSTYAELPPSPTMGALPSVEGSAVGMKDDESMERDLESLPPLPASRPSTPKDKLISASDAEETTPTQARAEPVVNIPGLFNGPGYAGVVDAAVAAAVSPTANAPSGLPYPKLEMPIDFHNDTADDETARTVVGDEVADLADVTPVIQTETDKPSSALEPQVPGDFAAVVNAAVARHTEPAIEEPMIPNLPVSTMADGPEGDAEPTVREAQATDAPILEVLLEEPKATDTLGMTGLAKPDVETPITLAGPATEDFGKEEAEPVGSKSLDETPTQVPETRDETLEHQPEEPSAAVPTSSSSKKNKKKKKKKGKSVDLAEASEPSVPEPLPSASKEDERAEDPVSTEPAPTLEEVPAVGQAPPETAPVLEETLVTEETPIPEDAPVTQDTPLLEDPSISERSLAPEEDPAIETLSALREASVPEQADMLCRSLVLEEEPQPEAPGIENTQLAPESGKEVESQLTRPEERKEPGDDVGLSKKAKKKKKKKSKTAAEGQTTGEPSDEGTGKSLADIVAEMTEKVEEPREPTGTTVELVEPVIEPNLSAEIEAKTPEEQISLNLDENTPLDVPVQIAGVPEGSAEPTLTSRDVSSEEVFEPPTEIHEKGENEEPVPQHADQVPEPTIEAVAAQEKNAQALGETTVDDEEDVFLPAQETQEIPVDDWEIIQSMPPQEDAVPAHQEKPEPVDIAPDLDTDKQTKEPQAEPLAEAQSDEKPKELLSEEAIVPEPEQTDDTAHAEPYEPPSQIEALPDSTESNEATDTAARDAEVPLTRKASKKKAKKNKRKNTTEFVPEAESADAQEPEKSNEDAQAPETQRILAEEETAQEEQQIIPADKEELLTGAQEGESAPTESFVDATSHSQEIDSAASIERDAPEKFQEDLPDKHDLQLPETSGEGLAVDEGRVQQDASPTEEPTGIDAVESISEKTENEPSLNVENVETNDNEPHVSEEPTIDRVSEPEAGENTPTSKKSKKKKKKKQSISATLDESSAAVQDPPPADVPDTEAPAVSEEAQPSLEQEPAADMPPEKQEPPEATEETDQQASPEPAPPVTAAQKKKAKKDRKKKRQSMALDETPDSEPAAELVTTDLPTEGDSHPVDDEPSAARGPEVAQPVVAEEPEPTETSIPEQVDVHAPELEKEENATPLESEPQDQEKPVDIEVPEKQEPPISTEEPAIPTAVVSVDEEPAPTDLEPAQEDNQGVVPKLEATPNIENQPESIAGTPQHAEEEEKALEIIPADNEAIAGELQDIGDQNEPKTPVDAETAQESQLEDFDKVEPKEDPQELTVDESPAVVDSITEMPEQEEVRSTLSKKDKKKKKKKRQSVSVEEDRSTAATEEVSPELPTETIVKQTSTAPPSLAEDVPKEADHEGTEPVKDEDGPSTVEPLQQQGQGDNMPAATEVTSEAQTLEDEQPASANDQDTSEHIAEASSKEVVDSKVDDPPSTSAPTAMTDLTSVPVTENLQLESQEQEDLGSQPQEEAQAPSSKKKERKKKKKKSQSISLEDNQPSPAKEDSSTEPSIEPAVEHVPSENDVSLDTSSGVEPAEPSAPEDSVPEPKEPEIEEPQPAEEVQTTVSKKKAKKDKKKRKSVSFVTEEPLAELTEPTETPAEASAEPATEPTTTEEITGESGEALTEPENVTKDPDEQTREQPVHEDTTGTETDILRDTQPTSNTAEGSQLDFEPTELHTTRESENDGQDISAGLAEPVTETPGEVTEKPDDQIVCQELSEQELKLEDDSPDRVEALLTGQEIETKEEAEKEAEIIEPEVPSEATAAEPSPSVEPEASAANDDTEPESKAKSKRDKKKKKKQKTLEESSIATPEAPESKPPTESEQDISTVPVEETEPENAADVPEKQEDDVPKSSKAAKRKAKKDKKRQSKNMDMEQDALITEDPADKPSEETPQEPSTPAEPVDIPEKLLEASGTQAGVEPEFSKASIETATQPAEDDGKENQSHDTDVHGGNDKSLTWTDDRVSSQVEQQPEMSSTYLPPPELEGPQTEPELVSVQADTAADIDAGAVGESEAVPTDQFDISADALKGQGDTKMATEFFEEQYPAETTSVAGQYLGEPGSERELVELEVGGQMVEATEVEAIDKTPQDKGSDINNEVSLAETERAESVAEKTEEMATNVPVEAAVVETQEAGSSQEKAEPTMPSRKLSKKQKKKQRQAEKAAAVQEQTTEDKEASPIPTTLDEQPSEPVTAILDEEVTREAEEATETPTFEPEPAITSEGVTAAVEASEILAEQVEKDEADITSDPTPVAEATQEDTVKEIAAAPEPFGPEIPATAQEEPREFEPVATKKKNKKRKGSVQPNPTEPDPESEAPAAMPKRDLQEDDDKALEDAQTPVTAPEQVSEAIPQSDKEMVINDPTGEEKDNALPVVHDEQIFKGEILSRKESKKKKKKAKKQAKEQLDDPLTPFTGEDTAEEAAADLKKPETTESIAPPMVESSAALEGEDLESQHPQEVPAERSASLEPATSSPRTQKEADAPSIEAAFETKEQPTETAKEEVALERQVEGDQQMPTEVALTEEDKEISEAPVARPEDEQPFSRKLSKKEKKKAKKKAASEAAEAESVPPEPVQEEVSVPQSVTDDLTTGAAAEPEEPSPALARNLSKKEKRKKRKEVRSLESEEPEDEQVRGRGAIGASRELSRERSQVQEEEPQDISSERFAQDDNGWPAIDWEKGKIDAIEQSSESSLEAHAAPFEPEIPEYHESAVPEALLHKQDKSRNSKETGDQDIATQEVPEGSQVPLETSVEHIEPAVHDVESTMPEKRRTEDADVLSHKHSKVSNIFPNLERGSFRRPVLSQISQPVKDGAEEETMDQEANRDSAIQVLEAPIAITEARDSGYIPSPFLAQNDSIFGEQLAFTATQDLPVEPTKPDITPTMAADDPFVSVTPYQAFEKPRERSIFMETRAKEDIPDTTRGLTDRYEIPLEAPMPEPEQPSPSRQRVDERDVEPETPCELRRSQSVHGRHSQSPPRHWTLEDEQGSRQIGGDRDARSPPRSPLHPIAEQDPAASGSGSMAREHGTPRLEMKPEHILPRPQTPVRKFTETALGRRAWPTSDEDRTPDQTDDDREGGVRKRSPQTRSPERGWTAEMFKTPERNKPILRPSSAGSTKSTTSLRHLTRSTSGDLRAAAAGVAAATVTTAAIGAIGALGAAGANQALEGEHQSEASTPQPPRSPTDLDVEKIASSSSYDPVTDKGKRPLRSMTDVYEGWGETPSSPRSPSRPPSVRHRRSMQHLQELEFRLDQLISENRDLAASRDAAENKLRNASLARRKSDQVLNTRDADLRDREAELEQLKNSVEWFQKEVARLNEENTGLTTTNSTLIAAHAHELLTTRETSTRELDELRSQNQKLSGDLQDKIRLEIETALTQKNSELRRLREELESARDKVKELQQQITASLNDNVVAFRDEDYFDAACQKLCGHVQQWILRFSKHSDHRRCRKLIELQDDKIADRFDNAILDGSDTDAYLADRVRRRDVFMSVVMTMVWEFIFTRYLFGMDREQRQKLKSLEKQLVEVGPRNAIHRWRATTLSLLAKRPAFTKQRESDTEAVALEIFETLSRLLPPPSHVETQLLESLRKILRVAVNLSIEMRTQLAEYIMLPPLQPEYDTNGDLSRRVFFNASLMNERSGETTSNDELESQQAVVRVVLFPLVVKKGNDSGDGDEEVVVCPAQVLIARPGKDKRLSRMTSGDRMSIDASKSVHSIAPSSIMDMSNVI